MHEYNDPKGISYTQADLPRQSIMSDVTLCEYSFDAFPPLKAIAISTWPEENDKHAPFSGSVIKD